MLRKAFAPLLPGQTVAVIAPAGPASAEALAAAPAIIEAMDLKERMYPGCFACEDYLAGDDDCRLADLHAAFADQDVAAILCLRGGYGSGRLLDRIDLALIRANPKPLIGFSDITALHALMSNAGLASFHGPMLTSNLIKASDPAAAFGLEFLRHGMPAGTLLQPALGESLVHVPGIAEGRLVGGNLSLVASLIGTPWALDVRDTILVLEDISEAPYRIDRLFLQLRLSGVLQQAAGFLIGHFTSAESPSRVLGEYLAGLGKPVLSGWPLGHDEPNWLLPLGVQARLDADAGAVELLEDVVTAALVGKRV